MEVERRKPRRKDAVYNQVLDDKGKRARGLCEKGRRFYAQMDANDGDQYRYLLQVARTVPEAETARQVLKGLQRQGKLFPPGKEPEPEPEQKEGPEPAKESKKEGPESGKAEETQNGRAVEKPDPDIILGRAIDGYQKDRDGLGRKKKARGEIWRTPTRRLEGGSARCVCRLASRIPKKRRKRQNIRTGVS